MFRTTNPMSNFTLLRNLLGRRASVTTPAQSTEAAGMNEVSTCYDDLDLSFKNTKIAFKGKKTSELIRGLIVLPLCSLQMLRKRDEMIMLQIKKICGKHLYKKILKLTFFGHFVGGETLNEVKETMIQLQKCGIKTILDYSVESDISLTEVQRKSVQEIVGDEPKTGTNMCKNEARCDRNCNIFCESADAIAASIGSQGINCIKLSALARPHLLLKLTKLIKQQENFNRTLISACWKDLIERKVKREFLQNLKNFNVHTDEEMMENWLDTLSTDGHSFVDFCNWSKLIDEHKQLNQMFQVYSAKTKKMEPLLNSLTPDECKEIENMIARIVRVIEQASKQNVRTVIDAEQTYFQPAISKLTMAMMRKFNKERGLVYNTYQAYLKNCLKSVEIDMHIAKLEGFHFGCKVVRGAYMDQERQRAAALNYEDPINCSIEETANMYKQVVQRIINEHLQRGPENVSVMVATHNEKSIRDAIKMMHKAEITPSGKTVCFAQLYGMCDHISHLLGQANYTVYKYVPYGPIDEVLPYLSRRVQENGAILSKVNREACLIFKELVRRIFTINE